MVRTFTEEERAFIKANYKNRGNKELTSLFNERFGTNFKTQKLKSFKRNRGWSSGLTGRFEKGGVSPHKGKKAKDFMSPEGYQNFVNNRFQKGNIPKNSLPIGSERPKEGGYTLVKTAEPKTWELKHVLIWEKYHGCKVPDGKIITFLDGNKNNFDIDNLEAVTFQEIGILNFQSLRFEDKDLAKLGLNIARMQLVLKKVKKEKE